MADEGDAKNRIALGGFGGVLAAAGVGIVSPGVKDAMLAGLNKRFGLDLYLNAPPWAGALMIVTGVLLLVVAFFGQARIERAFVRLFDGQGSKIGTCLAVKHVAGRDPRGRRARKARRGAYGRRAGRDPDPADGLCHADHRPRDGQRAPDQRLAVSLVALLESWPA